MAGGGANEAFLKLNIDPTQIEAVSKRGVAAFQRIEKAAINAMRGYDDASRKSLQVQEDFQRKLKILDAKATKARLDGREADEKKHLAAIEVLTTAFDRRRLAAAIKQARLIADAQMAVFHEVQQEQEDSEKKAERETISREKQRLATQKRLLKQFEKERVEEANAAEDKIHAGRLNRAQKAAKHQHSIMSAAERQMAQMGYGVGSVVDNRSFLSRMRGGLGGRGGGGGGMGLGRFPSFFFGGGNMPLPGMMAAFGPGAVGTAVGAGISGMVAINNHRSAQAALSQDLAGRAYEAIGDTRRLGAVGAVEGNSRQNMVSAFDLAAAAGVSSPDQVREFAVEFSSSIGSLPSVNRGGAFMAKEEKSRLRDMLGMYATTQGLEGGDAGSVARIGALLAMKGKGEQKAQDIAARTGRFYEIIKAGVGSDAQLARQGMQAIGILQGDDEISSRVGDETDIAKLGVLFSKTNPNEVMNSTRILNRMFTNRSTPKRAALLDKMGIQSGQGLMSNMDSMVRFMQGAVNQGINPMEFAQSMGMTGTEAQHAMRVFNNYETIEDVNQMMRDDPARFGADGAAFESNLNKAADSDMGIVANRQGARVRKNLAAAGYDEMATRLLMGDAAERLFNRKELLQEFTTVDGTVIPSNANQTFGAAKAAAHGLSIENYNRMLLMREARQIAIEKGKAKGQLPGLSPAMQGGFGLASGLVDGMWNFDEAQLAVQQDAQAVYGGLAGTNSAADRSVGILSDIRDYLKQLLPGGGPGGKPPMKILPQPVPDMRMFGSFDTR
jgi:hypothetical protein